jgi:hypothetical protein
MSDNDTDLKSILRFDSELNQVQDLDLLLELILSEARKLNSLGEQKSCYFITHYLFHL